MSKFILSLVSCFSLFTTYSLAQQNEYIQKDAEISKHELDKANQHLKHIETSSEESLKRLSEVEKTLSSKNSHWKKIQSVREAIYFSLYNNDPLKFNVIELTELSSSVVDSATRYKVPISLVLAVIKQESNFVKDAQSKVGAQGLMQLMPETAKICANEIGTKSFNILEIHDNVRIGTFYLRKLLKQFHGDFSLAVKAYNVGPDYTEKAESGLYSSYPIETIDYNVHVLEYKQQYEEAGIN